MANQLSAYELAEQLENMEPYATGDDLTLSNSAAMLRQQADRIAELEKRIVALTMNLNTKAIKVSELERQLKNV
jgi:hypothetical protein